MAVSPGMGGLMQERQGPNGLRLYRPDADRGCCGEMLGQSGEYGVHTGLVNCNVAVHVVRTLPCHRPRSVWPY